MYRERDRHSPCVQEWLNSVQTTVSNRGRDPPPSLEETCWEELRDMVYSPCPAVALLCGLKPVFALSGSLVGGENLSPWTCFALTPGESGVMGTISFFECTRVSLHCFYMTLFLFSQRLPGS